VKTHLKLDDAGNPVYLKAAQDCTPLPAWYDPSALATAVPGCDVPATLNGVPLAAWVDPSNCDADWESLATSLDEPPFSSLPGLKRASGAVVRETDGRLWIVSPSNAFGGYTNTFPKGTLPNESSITLRANAVREVWEETGLKVRLRAFLCDCVRSTSVTRYYLVERLAGTPSDMGWESQAVHLVPPDQLASVASHPNDRPVLTALREKVS
jgi:8-oxo-dGTP pyrophosphatase MutT (NUDIX family)